MGSCPVAHGLKHRRHLKSTYDSMYENYSLFFSDKETKEVFWRAMGGGNWGSQTILWTFTCAGVFVHMSIVCLYVCLLVSLCIWSILLFVCLFAWSIYLFDYLSVYISFYLSVCLGIFTLSFFISLSSSKSWKKLKRLRLPRTQPWLQSLTLWKTP